jgi:glycosyltransferase involved in cell wall biosynthesis
VNGLLVAPNSPSEVADAIEALHRDPLLAERLSRNARLQIRRRFNGETSARFLAKLLMAGAA